MGIAPINPDIDIADVRYDAAKLTYSPELKADDTSIVIGGFPDQYDQPPVNPDPVKPIVPDDAKNQTSNTSVANSTTHAHAGAIHPHTPFDLWVRANMTLVIIISSAAALVIIAVIACCCRKSAAK